MQTRLTAPLVAEIRRDVAAGHSTISSWADRLGLGWCTVEGAVYGWTWRSVTDPPPLSPPSSRIPAPPSNTALSGQIVAAMRRRYRTGSVSYAALAAEYGVGETTVRKAVLGFTWRHVAEPPVTRADTGGWSSVSDADRREIAERRRAGETFRSIAAALSLDVAVVHRAHTASQTARPPHVRPGAAG